MQTNGNATTTTMNADKFKSTSIESESPRKTEEGTTRQKRNPAEEGPTTQGKAKASGTNTATTEGFGGLLAMFRGLWKGNRGDKNDP